MEPGFNVASAICGLSLLLVLPCSEGFSPGSLVFLPPQKPTISKFHLDEDRGPALKPANTGDALALL